MKKLSALVLILALILSLVACGTGTGKDPDDSTTQDTGTTTPEGTNTTDPSDKEETNDPTDTNDPSDTDDPSDTTDPTDKYEVEAPGTGPADASNITSVGGVPLVTLNNGVEMPRFGLGTQIQRLENGELSILNETTRASVEAALRAGYRHLDTAHGYMNERGVGMGIKDSGVPREEIWITSKLWPSEYADAYNAVDQMLDRLGVEYIDLVYLHHPAGDIDTIVSAWKGLERAYREGKIRALGISNFDNRMTAFNAITTREECEEKLKVLIAEMKKEIAEIKAREKATNKG